MLLIRALIAIALASWAQEPQMPSPTAFEVVSIKPSVAPPGANGQEIDGLHLYAGGRVLCKGCQPSFLIMRAFDIQLYQLSGAPSWIEEDMYDVDGRPPAGSKASQLMPSNARQPPSEEQRRMLQSVLAERFQLEYHRETSQGAVYLLRRNSKRLKLVPTQKPDSLPVFGRRFLGLAHDGLSADNASLELIAKRLSAVLGRPVFDRTAIPGSFDVRCEYTSQTPAADSLEVIRACLPEIGLKLDAAKGPVERFVIDHVEKPLPN